jgi:hypothetical protein
MQTSTVVVTTRETGEAWQVTFTHENVYESWNETIPDAAPKMLDHSSSEEYRDAMMRYLSETLTQRRHDVYTVHGVTLDYVSMSCAVYVYRLDYELTATRPRWGESPVV